MTIEEFWNQAFLAALTRCTAADAKKEADEALEICIKHWRDMNTTWSPIPVLWQSQPIERVPKSMSDA